MNVELPIVDFDDPTTRTEKIALIAAKVCFDRGRRRLRFVLYTGCQF
jgi:hypothetical protein